MPTPAGASSPLLARAEQGDGLVDAPLPGIGALGGGDRVDVITTVVSKETLLGLAAMTFRLPA
jgi:hypothetical protein